MFNNNKLFYLDAKDATVKERLSRPNATCARLQRFKNGIYGSVTQ